MNKKINELEDLITKHKELYYHGKAIISDEEFDQLESELRSLDPDNKVLQMVGSAKVSGKIAHVRKMLSLDKTYDIEQLIKWIGDKEVVGTYKVDGSSCSLIYLDGELATAKTRGDGVFGEDIFKKITHLISVPLKIHETRSIEVRGEIYCSNEKFAELTHEMHARGLERPESQRNIVAGILGRKENVDLAKYLDFFAYDTFLFEENGILTKQIADTELKKNAMLKQIGFATPTPKIINSAKSCEEFLNEVQAFMNEGEYLIDGAVLTYNDMKLHDELGETAHHPRYKMAYKFVGETKIAKIKDLTWQISRNGTLTPVASIDPIELSGAMIARVTLHNLSMVKEYNLKAGDEIEIVRSGEVIPKFLRVVQSTSGHTDIPQQCPSCHTHLIQEDIRLRCVNVHCPAVHFESMLYFIQTAGVEDISDKRLIEMLNKKLITNVAQLLTLTEESFLTLDKVKEKMAKKMYQNIQTLKSVSAQTFITALGINGLAKNKVEKILSSLNIQSMQELVNLTVDQLVTIEGFAEKSSIDIISSIKNKSLFIQELIDAGVNVEFASKNARVSNRLEGLKFCITGTLSRGRTEIENEIKQNGGLIVTSVSKNTNYLVSNDTDSTSSKFVKAQSLNIPILDEGALKTLINKEN